MSNRVAQPSRLIETHRRVPYNTLSHDPCWCACEPPQVDADVDAPVCASVGFWDMARTIKADIDAFAKQPHLVRAELGVGGQVRHTIYM